jgi:hypothetical protein
MKAHLLAAILLALPPETYIVISGNKKTFSIDEIRILIPEDEEGCEVWLVNDEAT